MIRLDDGSVELIDTEDNKSIKVIVNPQISPEFRPPSPDYSPTGPQQEYRPTSPEFSPFGPPQEGPPQEGPQQGGETSDSDSDSEEEEEKPPIIIHHQEHDSSDLKLLSTVEDLKADIDDMAENSGDKKIAFIE